VVRVAAVTLVATCVTAAPAGATALAAFHTPGWDVQCYVVGSEHPPWLTCSQPNDGSYVAMSGRGRVERGVNPRDKGYHDFFASRRLLRFGHFWRYGVRFGCVSRVTCLKCRNHGGHGWVLERDGAVTVF
jgi:hypothetical protein